MHFKNENNIPGTDLLIWNAAKAIPKNSRCFILLLVFVFPGLNDGCKLQWEWVVITNLWTNMSIKGDTSIETKVISRD